MIDLTKIEKPFGLLTPEEQAALRAWPHGWEMFYSTGWSSYNGQGLLLDAIALRAKPAPLTKPSINWVHVADKFVAMATDAGGVTWLHDKTPTRGKVTWCGSSDYTVAHTFASFIPGTCDWKDSLVLRPGYEG
jgi:hypothetical protein